MTNKIEIGITTAIYNEFGMSPYVDDVEHILEDESCFLVTPLIITETQIMGNRYQRSYPFMVQYFTKTKDYNTEFSDITERLFSALEMINVDEMPIRCESMNASTVNDVLNFEVVYSPQMVKIRATDTELMETLEQNIGVKE